MYRKYQCLNEAHYELSTEMHILEMHNVYKLVCRCSPVSFKLFFFFDSEKRMKQILTHFPILVVSIRFWFLMNLPDVLDAELPLNLIPSVSICLFVF